MDHTVEDLAARGRSLSPEDRSRLVDLLLESLHEEPLIEVQAAWDAEVQRRLQAHDRGEIASVDGEEVLAQARRLVS